MDASSASRAAMSSATRWRKSWTSSSEKPRRPIGDLVNWVVRTRSGVRRGAEDWRWGASAAGVMAGSPRLLDRRRECSPGERLPGRGEVVYLATVWAVRLGRLRSRVMIAGEPDA